MNLQEAADRQLDLFRNKIYCVVRVDHIDEISGDPYHVLEDSSKDACARQILSRSTGVIKDQYRQKLKSSFKVISGGKDVS